MTDSGVLPFTIKPTAAASCLLITLLSLLLGVAVAEESRTAVSSAHIDQLNNAFQLLQLQLKQTTETAEHVHALLANLAQRTGRVALRHDLPAHGLPGKVALQEQAQEQKASSGHMDPHQGMSAPKQVTT